MDDRRFTSCRLFKIGKLSAPTTVLIHEKRNYPRRTTIHLSRTLEGTDFGRDPIRDTVYVSGLPPFDPDTGEIVEASIERQTELVLQQLKLCVETAGSSLDKILKCNVYCTKVDNFAIVNEVYSRFFPNDPPSRIFVNVPAWPGHFDIEIDCIAAL